MRLNPRYAANLLAVAAMVAVLATPSKAYYHYIHYLGSRNGPFTPIYEKFNLAALNNNTLAFFVSDQSPAVFAPNDSFGSVLSQVKQAVATWNAVPNSDLKLVFGGLENQNQASNTPGVDVAFIDLSPGVLGLGGPTTATSPVNGPNGQFFPIVRSNVMLTRDTTQATGPSYLEAFYTTTVHEIGHALGLQHTWTASAMSQDVIRNTSRARPLDADDIAGFSILYGKANWQANYGSITGRVTMVGLTGATQPAILASVVAISPSGAAISALTAPDGTYRIDGVPPGNYYLYAHPLPPDAAPVDNSGLRLPVDAGNVLFRQNGFFQTVFLGGFLDPQQSVPVSVSPSVTASGQDFSVQTRASIPIYDVVTYCRLNTATRTYIWSGDLTVPQVGTAGAPGTAFIDSTQNQPGLIIIRSATLNTPVPVGATILGGVGSPNASGTGAANSIQPYSDPPGSAPAVALYFRALLGAGTGPRHLVLNYGNDIVVVPDAVTLVEKGPPRVNAVTPNPDGTVTVTGAGFNSSSSVYFDGLAGSGQSFTGSDTLGSITVTPPVGASGQVSTVTVYNSDGQNSMILQLQNPLTYTYPVSLPPQITSVSQSSLPAGVTAAIDITASNARFDETNITVGFGSDDVTVKRVWVLSAQNPARLVANVVVSPGAAIVPSELSVVSGFQVIPVPLGFQTQPSRPTLPVVSSVVNVDSTQQTIYPGSSVAISGANLTPGGTLQLSLNGQPMQPQTAGVPVGQVGFTVPVGFPSGPASLLFSNSLGTAFPVEVQIDNPPPTITLVTNASGLALSGSNASGITVGSGDMINLAVSGLDSSVIGTSNLQVTVSGIPMIISQVLPLPAGQHQIQVFLTQSFAGSQVPVAVWVNGSASQPITITVR